MQRPDWQAVTAGVVTAVVGFTSSFAVVLAGLHAVGADLSQAASGLLAVTVGAGVACVVAALRTRVPLTMAWSTPGAALLASTGVVSGGWSAAVGAFAVCGVLLAAVGLWRRLADWIALIPIEIASAMLAGVLVPFCLAPITSLVDSPGLVAPVVALWLALLRFARRWAAPAAMALAVVLAFTSGDVRGLEAAALRPMLTWTTPTLTVAAVVSIALPLFVVTMASQNIPGAAVLAGFGYRVPMRPAMLLTGAATAVVAPFGGHAINLAALTAALAAGPEAGPDPTRRWRAVVVAGTAYVVLGLGSAAVAAVALAAPAGLVVAAAGLALLPTLAGAAARAFGPEGYREASAVTFLVTVSGVGFLGISSAFWGLVAGVGTALVLHLRRARRS